MKQTKLFFLAAAAIMVGCSNDDSVIEPQNVQQNDVAVNFGAYVNRTVSRAGQAGAMDLTTLKTSGFGVFGYYTDNGEYSASATPNFMYNQAVNYDGSNWAYAPVKYWPNETGSNAMSDDVDKMSFFAYAPYVPVEPATGVPTGDNTKNITQLSKNTATGDPIVKYIVDTNPATSVDLLWGVQPSYSDYAAVEGVWTPAPGQPYLDLVKAQLSTKVNFDFKHALTKLNVQIDADADEALNAASTRIYVRSITFTGFELKGSLNLNNTGAAPLWLDYEGLKEVSEGNITFADGRKDGKEATAAGEQKSELPLSLNPVLVQTKGCYEAGAFATAATAGVTAVPVNLFNHATASQPIFVIPTGEEMAVTIVYDVETIDPNLPGYLADATTHGSSIENRIYKEQVFGTSVIEAGKAYTLKLHLGMTSVKFDADVTDWDDSTADADVDLPENL